MAAQTGKKNTNSSIFWGKTLLAAHSGKKHD
jgi:hypothetical protein